LLAGTCFQLFGLSQCGLLDLVQRLYCFGIAPGFCNPAVGRLGAGQVRYLINGGIDIA
jgi:hypothetical protein